MSNEKKNEEVSTSALDAEAKREIVKPEEKEEKPEEEKKRPEDEIEVVEERKYTISLQKIWITPRGERVPRAVRSVREFVRRHMKTEEVVISNEVNKQLWHQGIKKPPRKIEVRALKDKDGTVFVYPAA